MLATERRTMIVRHLRERSTASVENLAMALGASVSTVRRDLDALQHEGLVRRVHGGATLGDEDEVGDPVPERPVGRLEEKQRIAARAAALVPPGVTVLVAGGSTTAQLVPHLREIPGLTVVTNSVSVAHVLATTSAVPVIVLGGYLRHPEMALLGQAVVDGLAHLRVDFALLSAYGLDPDAGMLGTDPAEADTDRHMIAAAPRLVLLADHTKFGRRSAVRVVPTDRIDTLVTDEGAPADAVDAFRSRGVDVVLC